MAYVRECKEALKSVKFAGGVVAVVGWVVAAAAAVVVMGAAAAAVGVAALKSPLHHSTGHPRP